MPYSPPPALTGYSTGLGIGMNGGRLECHIIMGGTGNPWGLQRGNKTSLEEVETVGLPLQIETVKPNSAFK